MSSDPKDMSEEYKKELLKRIKPVKVETTDEDV